LILDDGSLIKNTLNLKFQNAFTKPGVDDQVSKMDNRTTKKCELNPYAVFSPENVQKYLYKLKKAKTPGNDNMHPHVMREARSGFANVLSKLFISSYESGVLSEEWKETNVTPIFKKRSRVDPSN